MTKLEKLEREISALPPEDVHALGRWLDELRDQLWDKQIAAGSPALDALAAEALQEYSDGKTTPLLRK
jgi:hypothetical protein